MGDGGPKDQGNPNAECRNPTRCDGATARREEARIPNSKLETRNEKLEMPKAESLIPNLTCSAMEWQRGQRKSNADGLIAGSEPFSGAV